MTEAELRALIRRGEDQQTEFKAAEADAADIARAIVAMANSGGGTLLLGVGDDGSLLGLWYAQPPHIARHIRLEEGSPAGSGNRDSPGRCGQFAVSRQLASTRERSRSSLARP